MNIKKIAVTGGIFLSSVFAAFAQKKMVDSIPVVNKLAEDSVLNANTGKYVQLAVDADLGNYLRVMQRLGYTPTAITAKTDELLVGTFKANAPGLSIIAVQALSEWIAAGEKSTEIERLSGQEVSIIDMTSGKTVFESSVQLAILETAVFDVEKKFFDQDGALLRTVSEKQDLHGILKDLKALSDNPVGYMNKGREGKNRKPADNKP